MALVIQPQKEERLHRVESEPYVFPRGIERPSPWTVWQGLPLLVEVVLAVENAYKACETAGCEAEAG